MFHSCCEKENMVKKKIWSVSLAIFIWSLFFLVFGIIFFVFYKDIQEQTLQKEEIKETIVEDNLKKSFWYEIINDTVFIHGQGDFPRDFDFVDYHYNYRDSFSVAIIENGITDIPEGLFYYSGRLKTIIIFDDIPVKISTRSIWFIDDTLNFIIIRDSLNGYNNTIYKIFECNR